MQAALQDALALVHRARGLGLRSLEAGAPILAAADQVEGIAAQVRGLVEAGLLGGASDPAAGAGATRNDLVADLQALAGALRTADLLGVRQGVERAGEGVRRLAAALAAVEDRTDRWERARQVAEDARQGLVDAGRAEGERPQAVAELQLQESVYRGALASTERVLPQRLVEFLR